jgi:hypothetical protein
LNKLVKKWGCKRWKKLAEFMPTRSSVQCMNRWSKILKPGLMKGPWTLEEDRKLFDWVKSNGTSKWTFCAETISGRTGKQCRERWYDTLDPHIEKGGWTPKEDYLIFSLYAQKGSKWSKIAVHFPRRTQNSIKNRFYSTLRSFMLDEKMKQQKESNNSDSADKSFYKELKMDQLLQYFPQVLEEKTKNYLVIALNHNQIGEEYPCKHKVLLEVKEEKFQNRKRERCLFKVIKPRVRKNKITEGFGCENKNECKINHFQNFHNPIIKIDFQSFSEFSDYSTFSHYSQKKEKPNLDDPNLTLSEYIKLTEPDNNTSQVNNIFPSYDLLQLNEKENYQLLLSSDHSTYFL